MNDFNKIVLNIEKNDSFYCDRLMDDNSPEQFIGFGSSEENIIMILISFFGIFINLYFFLSSIKRIINNDKSKNANISSIEKILCVISITETFISICWLINSFAMETTKELLSNCDACRAVGVIELFLYVFDWMILSSTLVQIKQILINPLETLKTEKNIIKYIIFCFFFGLFNAIFGFYADVEGASPMLTCFIDVIGWDFDDYGEKEKIYRKIFYILFFFIPICVLLFGIYQVYRIIKLPQYKNHKKNRKFFKSYILYIITYIILALLLISVYVVDYIIKQIVPTGLVKGYINLVTMLSCSTPLIVGTIRLVKTKLIKKLFFCFCNKKKRSDDIDYDLDMKEKKNEDYHFVEFEQELICKEFKKIFIGISYVLDKSKDMDNNEEEKEDKEDKEEININNNMNNQGEKDNFYKINKQEILKDFDLEINEDIFVLGQEEIDIEATEYFPEFFKKIRKTDNIKEENLVKVFQPKNVTSELFIKTNDSNYYINSTNKQFILKSISLEQIEFYSKNLKGKIGEYLEKNNDSIINRVYGLFYLKIDQNKNYYIALMENTYESIDNNLYLNNKKSPISLEESNDTFEFNENPSKNNNEEKKMYINANEINDKIRSNNIDESSIFEISRSRSIKKSFIKKESIFITDKKFKIYLIENECNRLRSIMQKDIEFLRSVGTNRAQFLVVKKTVNRNLWNNLFPDIYIQEKNSENDSNNIGIKKYIFKSNLENVIYCITISGYFNNYYE